MKREGARRSKTIYKKKNKVGHFTLQRCIKKL